jgi:hypothetical protein
MNPVDAGNPYQAPEASIVALRAEIRRPPVYTAISQLCWVIGAFHLVGCLFVIGVVIRKGLQLGWEKAIPPTHQVSTIAIVALGFLGTLSYLTAGRWLRDNRGRPGLLLCCSAIGMTYLIIWIMNR